MDIAYADYIITLLTLFVKNFVIVVKNSFTNLLLTVLEKSDSYKKMLFLHVNRFNVHL